MSGFAPGIQERFRREVVVLEKPGCAAFVCEVWPGGVAGTASSEESVQCLTMNGISSTFQGSSEQVDPAAALSPHTAEGRLMIYAGLPWLTVTWACSPC